MLELRARTRWKGLCAGVLGAAMSLSCAAPADHARPAPTDPSSFGSFCATWMGKLAERERSNLASATARRRGDRVVVEYVGYARSSIRCEAEPSGLPSNPFVGKLVYEEHRYERAGESRADALASPPRVVSALVVMEIFRFDGSRWVY
jgi:hypothetical protein